MIIFILSMLFGIRQPAYYGPIYCGPMYDEAGHFDKATSDCVGRVLFAGRRAVVKITCRDGSPALVQVWLDDDSTLDLQSYDEVCGEHNATSDGGTE